MGIISELQKTLRKKVFIQRRFIKRYFEKWMKGIEGKKVNFILD